MKYSVLVFFALLLAGCDRYQPLGKDVNTIHKVPILLSKNNNVVLIYQDDNYSCATTSVAMAISYYENRNTDPINKNDAWDVSRSNVKLVNNKGNDVYGLINICNHFHYQYSFIQNSSLNDLENIILNNLLAVAFINIDGKRTHAVLITGYNLERKELFINDPGGSKTKMRYSDFNNHWSAWLGKPHIKTTKALFIIYPK